MLTLTSSHSPKRGLSPQFSAHAYCGRTAAWIKMPLGMEVGLGPCHIVLDQETAPPLPKGHSPHQFLAHICCGQTAGWLKMPLYGGRAWPRRHCVRWGPSSPLRKKGTVPPNFWSMSIVAKRLDGSRYYLIWR